MRRRVLALGAVLALALLAGCFGPTQIPDEQLADNATYEWDRGADAAYTLSRSSYTAVFNVSNRSTLSVYDRDALGVEAPVDLSALRYRFANGSVVAPNGTANLSATLEQRRTVISLPATDGQVGYTASRSGKQFTTPVVVPGSQSVTLPPGARVGVPLLSQVSPGDHTTSVSDNRMTVSWSDAEDGALTVHYYLQRDLLLFTALVLVVTVVGVAGLVYYFRQLRQLESAREDIGLDVETEDDDVGDDGPPPGMR
jgi:hypothetical protein